MVRKISMQLSYPTKKLQLSRPLYTWLKSEPDWRKVPLSRKAWAIFDSLFSSLNWTIANHLTPPKMEPLFEAPILITGIWRSGTTALHESMTSTLDFATPRTFQCMAPSQMHLNENKEYSTAKSKRPMDDQLVSAMSPQEDEFALLSLGVPSLYRAFLMPHRALELLPLLDEEYWLQHHSEWLDVWHRFIQLVCRQQENNRKNNLLLKSPNHTFRLASILTAHPDARLIWMIRDAEDLYQSNVTMWSAMCSLYGWSKCDEAQLLKFLTMALCVGTNQLEKYSKSLSQRQLLVVKQSELLTNGNETVTKIAKWLNLGKFNIPNEFQNSTFLHSPLDLRKFASYPEIGGLSRELAKKINDTQEIAYARRGFLMFD